MTPAGAISLGLSSGWFDIRPRGEKGMSVMTIKPEHMKDFQTAMTKQFQAVQKMAVSESQRTAKSVSLSDEQLQALSEKYDAKDMTQEEYEAFLDELCGMGALSGEDLNCLSYGPLRKLDFSEPVARMRRADGTPHLSSLADAGGNALAWARFQASFQVYDPDSQSFYHDRTARLFNRLADILERL